MTEHARSSSFLLLTGNEAPQDALLSIESIEVRPLVPKGILSVRQTGSYLFPNGNAIKFPNNAITAYATT